MLEIIIVILLVIGLSYLFRQNSNDTFNTQMLFILLTLGCIIFYKIIYVHNNVKDKEMLEKLSKHFNTHMGERAKNDGIYKV